MRWPWSRPGCATWPSPARPPWPPGPGECLHAFEQADATSTAVRVWFLGAFTAAQGYAADADYSPAA
jgi:hypothetical protein